MTGSFGNPGVFSYAMISRCRPNSRVFSYRHIYSLWPHGGRSMFFSFHSVSVNFHGKSWDSLVPFAWVGSVVLLFGAGLFFSSSLNS